MTVLKEQLNRPVSPGKRHSVAVYGLKSDKKIYLSFTKVVDWINDTRLGNIIATYVVLGMAIIMTLLSIYYCVLKNKSKLVSDQSSIKQK